MADSSEKTRSNRSVDRKDGRQSLLIYLKPEIIRDLKKAAIDRDRHAYEIAEEALASWLAQPPVRSKS